MNRVLDVASSIGTSITRLGSGGRVGKPGARPEQTLDLYDFEGCPFCRKVREAFTILDLEANVYPCPKGGPRFREDVVRMGGKAQFPYLVDANTGKALYESDDINRYLFAQYGDGRVPGLLASGPANTLTAVLSGAFRPGLGVRYRKARAPERQLELWSFEGSPFCRLVRETLTCLELPYRLYNVGKGSERREAFVARSGRMLVPYLADPNTGAEMFESADIVSYLEHTYAL